jgi:penicillin G amidase
VARRRTRGHLIKLAAFVSGLCLFIALVLGGGFLWLRSSLPETDGTLILTGLQAPVTISRDRDGIPHIRAETDNDAYFALGFVHAQDRLWQMEATRRVGQGRLAEIVGKVGLPSDRFSRVLGYEQLAKTALAQLSPDARAAVDAYTAGINAWLQSHSGALPPEFLALRFTPEPWRAEDCLLWGKLMATRLSNWPMLSLRLRLATSLGPDELTDLFPPYPGNAPITVDDAELKPGQKRASLDDSDTRITAHYAAPLPLSGSDPRVPSEASNIFAVAGTGSESGKPLLANDPHLGFDAPNLWYLVRIDTPDMTLAGATVPSIPFLIIGHNRNVGWGFTTTGAETDAIFAERPDPSDSAKIAGIDGPETLSSHDETIAVAGDKPEHLVVRASRHGPIISDVMRIAGLGEDEIAALSSPSLRENDRTAEAFYRLNQAQSAADFREGLRDFQAPMQNAAFADTEGHTGFVTAGLLPIRTRIEDGGIRPGWSDSDEERYVPFDELPQVMDPPSGRIVNANNKVAGDKYPYYLGMFWADSDRAQRINALLSAQQKVDTTSLSTIQTDAVSLGARTLLPRLLPLVAEAGLSSAASTALNSLSSWDGAMSRNRPEPLIYHAWIAELAHSLAAGRNLGDNGALIAMIGRPMTLMRILDSQKTWCASASEESANQTCQPLVAGAFATAIDDLTKTFGNDPSRWRWGDAHRAVFANRLFAGIPLLDRLSTIDVSTDGDDDTVNRGTIGNSGGVGSQDKGSYFYQPPLYPGVHGPGLRAIMDFSNLDNSLFMQATGQSGNLLSSHYRDLSDRWADGQYLRLPRESGVDRGLILTPPAKPRS